MAGKMRMGKIQRREKESKLKQLGQRSERAQASLLIYFREI
jgi:hypothetical protein